MLTHELLDPESWTEVLNLYAHAMQVAVALTDTKGQLLGICHNPQPIWSLARAATPEWGDGCLFCLQPGGDPGTRCTAVADALRTGAVALAHDFAGFAHVTLPIFLGDEHLGTLIAGQVFDAHPEPLALDRLAKAFGFAEEPLWTMARQQLPVSGSNLRMFGQLLITLGQALVGQRYSTILGRKLATSDAELDSATAELKRANSDLEAKVAELSQSVGEKAVLLQEVHHRVNNNLQVIVSLLRLQSESFADSQLADALRTTQLRIESMALIHAQLYESSDLKRVNFSDYTARLVDSFAVSYGVDRDRISFCVNMRGLTLSVGQAIPAGLILGELVSNALKYAFPNRRSGSIFIEGQQSEERVEISVRDDGVGIQPHPEKERRKSRGLQIVGILCDQLHGTMDQTPRVGEPGTVFRISFIEKRVI